jgi:hypothetical protein
MLLLLLLLKRSRDKQHAKQDRQPCPNHTMHHKGSMLLLLLLLQKC